MFFSQCHGAVFMQPVRQFVQTVPVSFHGVGLASSNSAPSFDDVYKQYMDVNGSVAGEEIHFNDKAIALIGENGLSRQEVLADPKKFLQSLSADDIIALHSINDVPISCEYRGESVEELELIDPLEQVRSYSEEGCLNLLSMASEMVDLNKDGDAVYGKSQFKTVFPPQDAPGAIRQAWNAAVNESSTGVASFVQNSITHYGYTFPVPLPPPGLHAMAVGYCHHHSPVAYVPAAPIYVAPPPVTISSFAVTTEMLIQEYFNGEKDESQEFAANLMKKLEEVIAQFEQFSETEEVA